MKILRTSRTAALLLLFAMLGGLMPQAGRADASLRVVTSIKPVHSILAGLMEGSDAPVLLIHDDRSPYDYKPNQADLHRMQQADLLFWVGPELEPGLAAAVKGLGKQVKVIELLSRQSLKILPSRGGGEARDPYFWLDNRNVMILLDDITRLLQAADPKRAHLYERNRHRLLMRLARIDREYEYGYRGMKAGLGVQYYDTLQYFEQAYALKILAQVAASPLQPVKARDLLAVRQRLVDGEAVCLLSEKGLPADDIPLLLSGTRANHGELNSLGIGIQPGPDLYFEIMDRNTDTIKRCLNADMQAAETAREQAETGSAPATAEVGGGPFALSDQFGRVVTPESMRGKYAIVYFGYTYCPDVCPTSLQVMLQALDLLGKKGDNFQPYFITVDPERDTVAVMRNYVQYYDDRLIGLTGSREMIERVAADFKVRYEKVVDDKHDPSMYLMDHSASLYVLDPQGRFLAKYAHGIEPEALASRLRELLQRH